MIDEDKPVTQAFFAEWVGISERHVRNLLQKGTLRQGGSLLEWTQDYTGSLRDEAAARATSNGLVLSDERAALAKAQRERVERENKVERDEYVETWRLEAACKFSADAISARFSRLPEDIKRAAPDVSPKVLAIVEDAVARVLLEAETLRLPIDAQLAGCRGGDDDEPGRGD